MLRTTATVGKRTEHNCVNCAFVQVGHLETVSRRLASKSVAEPIEAMGRDVGF